MVYYRFPRFTRGDVFDGLALVALAFGYAGWAWWYGGSFWIGLLQGSFFVALGAIAVYYFGELMPGVGWLLNRPPKQRRKK